MKGIRTLTAMLFLWVAPLHAVHDNGQGKSQDGKDHTTLLGSTAVAPEPETYMLFLVGLGMLAAWHRSRSRQLSS